MIRVSVEVGGRVPHFRLTLRAQSIERAVSMVRARYPDCEVKVMFPIDPDTFFAEEVADIVETMRIEMPTRAVS